MNRRSMIFLISYFILFVSSTDITFIGTGSGTADVSFVLSANMVDVILGNYKLTQNVPHSNYVMGYRATLLTSSNHSHQNGYLKQDKQGYTIIKQLLEFIPLKETIITHIHERIEEMFLNSFKYTKFNTQYSSRSQNSSQITCTPPIIGPDSWTKTQYDPDKDDCGFFSGTHQSENNCYAYGTDIATDTYPQPGRGSGQKWQNNTCEDIIAAAQRDGLKWIGSSLTDYSHGPINGHYVALYIWPNTNFHWARMDYNGTYNNSHSYVKNAVLRRWSHKPGTQPIQTVDNNGNCIGNVAPCVLPSEADLSPWSVFCGYLSAVPTNLTIE